MYKKIVFVFSFLFAASMFSVTAQTPLSTPARQNSAAGEVVSVTDKSIIVQTKDGPIEAILSPDTAFKKVPPGGTSILNSAVASSFSEIEEGDKVLISGLVSLDKKTMPAKTVYLMTKSDLSQKKASEAAWRTRGIAGRVTGINALTKQITVEVKGMMGATNTLTVTPKEGAVFKRYAPHSALYADAKMSSVGEINVGDGLRAIGDKSMDGTTFTAEEILTGAFQTTIGVVKEVDVAKNELVIEISNIAADQKKVQPKKELTIAVTGSTLFVKQYPAEIAARFANMQAGGGPGPGGQVMVRPAGPAPAGPTPPGGGQAQGNPSGGGPGMGGPGRGGSFEDMVDRFPDIKVADIKVGDTIAVVSNTKTETSDHIAAIKLLSGVAPLLQMAQKMAAAGGGQPQGGRNNVNGNFTIPGLDGFGGP